MRLSQIENLDLNLFDFDKDTTMMIFFFDAKENVYARYGGRNSESADAFQSPAGLRHTMESVLAMHQAKEKLYAKRTLEKPVYLRDFRGGLQGFGRRRCYHCHDVKEVINDDLWKKGKWKREMAWRYPSPDQVGMVLDVDRPTIVEEVLEDMPAAEAGIQKGDVLRMLNDVPIHSIGDVQFALDRAPETGTIDVSWDREGKRMSAKLKLFENWEKNDISWRPSSWALVPSLHVFGSDLEEEEKKALGLKPDDLAFRQRKTVHSHARKAGIQPGDIIVGVDGKAPEEDAISLLQYVRRVYLVDDVVKINVIREGKRIVVPMKLIR